MKRALVVLLLVMFVALQGSPVITASMFSARIERDMINVRISSRLSQNITSLFDKEIHLSGEPLVNLTKAFDRQIRARSPEATVKDLSADCVFRNESVEVSVQFNVVGTVIRRNEVVTANLTWRAFDVPDDVSVENVRFNLVGNAYFGDVVRRFENATSARFYENRTIPVTTYRAREILGNITMLRFKPLGVPLSKWKMIYNTTKAETTYKLDLGKVVDIAVRREFNASTTEYGVLMSLAGEITAPGYARLKQDVIEAEVYIGASQYFMFTAVTTALIVAIVARTVEKKRSGFRLEAKRRRRLPSDRR
jgi:hypothetical protein